VPKAGVPKGPLGSFGSGSGVRTGMLPVYPPRRGRAFRMPVSVVRAMMG